MSKSTNTFNFGDLSINRLGYGAMRLSGPHIFGPPANRSDAIAVLRTAIELGVNHIDTADFYGPHTTNQLIREALHPYRHDLVIGTKVGVRRGSDASWLSAASPEELELEVHNNLRNLGVEQLDIVNFRVMIDPMKPAEGSIEAGVSKLAELQQKGLVRYIGLSNVTVAQVAEGRRVCDIACVQNQYNITNRNDHNLIDELARDGIAYVPFFPLGGFSPLQSNTLSDVATRLQSSPNQVALAWLLQRAPNILLIPGTTSIVHLKENLAVGELTLPDEVIAELDRLAS